MTNIILQNERAVAPIRRERHSQRTMSSNTPNQKRILLIAPAPPFPLENGTNQRTLLLWKALSEIAPVDVILCDDSGQQQSNGSFHPGLSEFPWKVSVAVERALAISSFQEINT